MELSPRLLIVDDEQAQLDTLADIMTDEGFDVVTCSKVADALEKFKQNIFGVAIVDLRLPDLHGTQLLEKINTISPHTQAIIHTAYGSFESAKIAVNLHAFAYIEKLGNPEELIQCVHKAFHEYFQKYAKKLQSVVNKQNKTLWEFEEKYRLVVETMNEALAIQNDKEQIIYVNPSFCKMLGFKEKELKGCSLANFFHTKSKDSEDSQEITFVRKDGSLFPAIISQKNMVDVEGHIKGTLTVITDIRQQKQLAQTEKMASVGLLAGGVANNLNNILTPLLGYTDMLLLESVVGSSMYESLSEIKDAGIRAVGLVQDLLTLSRKKGITTQVLDINQVVHSYFNSLEFEQLQNKYPHIKFITKTNTTLNIIGSETHLRKAIVNLLKNATQAIGFQQGKIVVTTLDENLKTSLNNDYNSAKAGDYIIIKVEDNGRGIPFENLKHIFEPFYSQKIPGKKIGLGMAIVWATVKDHSGYIDIKSKDRSTIFYIYLPATSKATAKEKYLAYQSVQNETVLIIENEESLRKMLVHMLKKLKYNVVTVESGEEAVEYLSSHTANLVLLNMTMKTELSTLETYRKISKIHPQQKAILVDGNDQTSQIREMQKLGAGTHVKKPYTLDKIGIAIRNELDK